MKATRIFGLGAITMLGCGGAISEPLGDGGSVAPAPTATGSSSSSGGRSSSSSGSSSGFTSSSGGTSTSSSGGTVGCPEDYPLTEADLDKDPGWHAAAPSPSACSTADIQQLESNFKNTGVKTYFDLGTGLSDACAACAITKDTDASWGPIVGEAANNGQSGFVNFGACFGYVEGESCGKALQYEQFCYGLACDECTTTSTERQKCIEKAGSSGMCTSFADTTAKACPNIQTTAKKCNSIIDAVKTLCGTP